MRLMEVTAPTDATICRNGVFAAGENVLVTPTVNKRAQVRVSFADGRQVTDFLFRYIYPHARS